MKYKLIGVIEHLVTDMFNIEVEADSPEEAQDLVYEVLSEYPNSELKVDKLLRIETISERPTSIAIEFKREEDEVFDDGESDDDGEGR